ncbi:MAG: exo-alpha-sialidase [Lentisphaerae bacterium]|nr:exo-alpha-sialidase [Lentisphaerota bacterium]
MTDPVDHPAPEPRRAEAESPVYAVPEDKRISVGAPSLIALPNGKLLAAFDQTGPDVKSLAGKKGHDAKRNRWMQGRVMASADGGATWQLAATYPFRRASLFRDGGDVYLVGEASGGLCLMRSPDGGGSWSAPVELTGDLDLWLSPTTVLAGGDAWYLPSLMASGGGMGLAVRRVSTGGSQGAWRRPLSRPIS